MAIMKISNQAIYPIIPEGELKAFPHCLSNFHLIIEISFGKLSKTIYKNNALH